MTRTDRDIKIGDRIGIRGASGAMSPHRWTPVKRGYMIEVSYVSRTPQGTLVGGVQITQTGRRVKAQTYRQAFVAGPDGEQRNSIPALDQNAEPASQSTDITGASCPMTGPHDAHPIAGSFRGSCPGITAARSQLTACDHGYAVEGRIETCPHGCTLGRSVDEPYLIRASAGLYLTPSDAAMPREHMAAWFRARGVHDIGTLDELLAQYAAKNEAEMDQIYTDMHS